MPILAKCETCGKKGRFATSDTDTSCAKCLSQQVSTEKQTAPKKSNRKK